MTTRTRQTKADKLAEKVQARQTLRPLLPPGTTLVGIVTQVSRDGTSGHIRLFVGEADSSAPNGANVREVTCLTALACGMRLNRDGDALLVGGCGMDMIFHVVQSLSYALHGYGRDDDTAEQTEARLNDGPAVAWAPAGEDEYHKSTYHPRRPGYTLRSR